MKISGDELNKLIEKYIKNAYLNIDKSNADKLTEKIMAIFDLEWCHKNADEFKNNYYEDLHPFMDDTICANGKGLTIGLCKAISLANKVCPKLLENETLPKKLRNKSQFKATLFELAVISNLANQGVKIKELESSTKKGDVEALIEIDGNEILVECKILDESDLSKEIEELINWGIPSPAEGEIIFKEHPFKEDFKIIKDLFTSTIENQQIQKFENERIKVETIVSDKCNLSYTLGFDDVKRQKNTLRKTIKKIDKNRTVWLFCGAFPDSRQNDAIDGFNELLEEKRYAKKVNEISIVLLRHTMEFEHMGYWSLVSGKRGELKSIKN